jgi:preprotein translocase subunit SecD
MFIAFAAIASPVMPDFSIFGKNIGKYLRDLKIDLGLDLEGGAHLVYKADMSRIPSDRVAESLSGARDVIERRVNAYGISEPEVTTSQSGGEQRITVDLAGAKDISLAVKMIGETPILEFWEEKTDKDYALTDSEKTLRKEQNQAKKVEAEAVLKRALSGEDFSKLAKKYSEDPGSKEAGGDLDFYKKNGEQAFVPELETIFFNSRFIKGSVWRELVKSPFGYHILKKTNERGEGDGKEVRTSHILFLLVDEEKKEETTGFPFKPTGLSGKNLKDAQVVFDQNTQEPQVSLRFDEEGKNLFREITERNQEKRVAILLDGQPVTVPVVRTVIADGQAVITGSRDLAEAKDLAKRLNSGALPVPIELLSQELVGASLGKVSLQQSLTAGAFGLALVSGFMIAFYLLPGLIAVLALAFYAVTLVAVFKILGVTLTLAGIAGFVLSLGMAVDANVLIFERMKEELREGRNMKTALKNAEKRAWPSIRDGNFSTLITCVILAGMGTGSVKGFAITLGVGIIFSMFSAIFVSQTILGFLEQFMGKKLAWGLVRKSRITDDEKK